ncbi:hypothetical protein NECAME_18645 [Necator americanus]|uniref:Uncharacterized protein n=1 Tax=Necator americanus TaxID=51031 RepID=W2SVM5_NECAM|nr:hypothetical protein NECAME_18645 [Necator americanus]ETN72861.1 hypothetical protein NECAME_18645 [Necator americanus]
MVGARGWKADYALVVTWERMSYGGAPKITDMSKYEQAKRWEEFVTVFTEKKKWRISSKIPIKWFWQRMKYVRTVCLTMRISIGRPHRKVEH